MSPELKQKLLIILSMLTIPRRKITPARNFQSVYTFVLEQELLEETGALKALFAGDDPDDIEIFKTLCRERAMHNTNTCLSLNSLSDGACNQLYFDLTREIFSPQSMADLLALLLPDVTTCIKPMVVMTNSKLDTRHFKIELSESPVSALTLALNTDKLADFVIHNNYLFDIEEIARFDFNLHEAFYHELTREHPEFAERLYRHNLSLRTLCGQIQMVNGDGQIPREVIKAFIHELRLGGEKMTGIYYASLPAQLAYTNFLCWEAALPDDTRENLSSLTSSHYKQSFASVIKHLNEERCVELAANYLQAIIENPHNDAVLNAHPNVSNEFLETIKNQYKRGSQIATSCKNSTTDLPSYYLEQVLSHIDIHNAEDYLSLLLCLPINLYIPLLKQANITCQLRLPNQLANMIYNGILNQEQLQALNQAIVNNVNALGGFSKAINFAIRANNMELIPMLLDSAGIIDRLNQIRLKEMINGRTLLQCIAHDPITLRKTLDLIPQDYHFEAINAVDDFGHDLFHFASKNPLSLEMFLQLYPEQGGLIARRVKDCKGRTRVHHAIESSQSLRIVLQLYLPSEQKIVALVKDNNGYTPLHLAAMEGRHKAVQILLQLFSQMERHDVVRIKDANNHSILDYARGKPKVMQSILNLLRPDIALIQKELNNLVENSSRWFWGSNRKKNCQLEMALKKALLKGLDDVTLDKDVKQNMPEHKLFEFFIQKKTKALYDAESNETSHQAIIE